MRRLTVAVFLALLTVVVATRTGVKAQAPSGPIEAMVADEKGKPIEDAVVSLTPLGTPPATPPASTALMDQHDKEFVPYVLPLYVGTRVTFPNRDNIRHHVYSFSSAKKFELPLYTGTPAQPMLFDKPGVVKLGCNIHDWMIAYIYVAETPYFGKSEADGRVNLDTLPPGRYHVRVWHPLMQGTEGDTVKRVELRDAGASTVEWKLKLKSEFRPRRQPLPGEAGYR